MGNDILEIAKLCQFNEKAEAQAVEDYTEMIEFLNSSDFRTFGEGLTFLISKRINDDESSFDCLKRCFEEKGILIKELGNFANEATLIP